jgi:hypothetical protein
MGVGGGRGAGEGGLQFAETRYSVFGKTRYIVSSEADMTQQWRIETPQSIDVEGVRRLQVRLVGGRVDVVGRTEDAESGAAHIEVTRVDGPVVVTLADGVLQIAHEKLTWGGVLDWLGGGRRTHAVVSVSVPAQCPVQLGVVSADAVVSGIVAEATAVKSVSGDVTLDGLTSGVTARTVSGALETRRLDGNLDFTTVSGDLTVVAGSTSRLRANSVSGDLTLDLDVDGAGALDLRTVSGDVTLRLPDAAALAVDVATTSGSLQSEFDGLHTERRPGQARMSGSIGSGSGRLRATTVSGDVVLLARVRR